MIDINPFVGKIYKLAGCSVKVCFGNGDDTRKDIQTNPAKYLNDIEDELCLFGYGEQSEYYIATIDPLTGRIFDVDISNTLLRVTDLANVADLEAIDDAWIDNLFEE